MNTESQNIEFKDSWYDEYQKWTCSFANAQGGSSKSVCMKTSWI